MSAAAKKSPPGADIFFHDKQLVAAILLKTAQMREAYFVK